MLTKSINYILLSIAVVLGTVSLLPPLSMFMVRKAADLEFYSFTPQPVNHSDYPPNNILDSIDYIHLGKYEGPESIAINKKGDIYFGLKSGQIRYIKKEDIHMTNSSKAPMNKEPILLVTVGRPLGLYFDNDDNLLIADSVKGLLRVDKDTNDIQLLTASCNEKKLTFINDVVCAPDGMIYFTDSAAIAPIYDKDGDWDTFFPSIFACYSLNPSGRALSYNPKTRETKEILTGLTYANGITIDEKGEYLYVAETPKSTIWKHHLKGNNAGKSQILMDNLPGYPDNIRMGKNGIIYIGIFSARRPLFDLLQSYPMVKRAALRLPFLPRTPSSPFVVLIDSKNGSVKGSFQATNSPMKTITSALEHNGLIYFGNLHNDLIGVMKINN